MSGSWKTGSMSPVQDFRTRPRLGNPPADTPSTLTGLTLRVKVGAAGCYSVRRREAESLGNRQICQMFDSTIGFGGASNRAFLLIGDTYSSTVIDATTG